MCHASCAGSNWHRAHLAQIKCTSVFCANSYSTEKCYAIWNRIWGHFYFKWMEWKIGWCQYLCKLFHCIAAILMQITYQRSGQGLWFSNQISKQFRIKVSVLKEQQSSKFCSQEFLLLLHENNWSINLIFKHFSLISAETMH